MGVIKIPPKVQPPPYVHQEYPKHIFSRGADGVSVVNKIVRSREEHAALAKQGWAESPEDLPEAQPASSSAALTEEQLTALLDENETLRRELDELKAAKASKAGKDK